MKPVPERREHSWRLTVGYRGTRFAGWQKQAGARTVQGTLEEAFSRLSGEPVVVKAAGRTDAGVHARAQLVTTTFAARIPEHKMLLALNSQLPDDVSVISAVECAADFDAKRDSIAKRYVYRIHNAVPNDPFFGAFRWHVRGGVDVEKMQRAAVDLIGELDFESFRSAQCDALHARRYVWCVDVSAQGPLIEIDVRGNAFCRNMVRVIAGTLVDIGRGKYPVDAIPGMLAAKSREAAGITAPAEGLTLEEVYLRDAAARAGIPEGAVFPGWPTPKGRRGVGDAGGAGDELADVSENDDDDA
jgi:tRNA pseudouridine38-40 synthase